MNSMDAVLSAKKDGAVYPGDQQQKGTTMSEKCIDLGPHIAKDTEVEPNFLAGRYQREVLAWLDEHPDQVPGRTITVSECNDLERLGGITVVPDLKPTLLPSVPGATVKMRKHHQWVRTVTGAWISADGSILDEDGAQKTADEHGFEVMHDGVTAPGVDYDQ